MFERAKLAGILVRMENTTTSSKKNFLLVEHGGSRKQFTLDVLLADQELTLYIATSTVPDWLLEIVPRERIIQTDTYNSVRLLTDVVAFVASQDITLHGIGTFFEHTVVQTADVARALGLIGIDPGAARRSSSNKLLMRMTCRAAGVPTPKFTVLPSLSKGSLRSGVAKVGTPCVIKPIFGSESYGVVKIEDGFDPDMVISEITGNTGENKKEVFKNFPGTFIIEEYLAGPVISVDGVVAGRDVHIAGIVEFVMGPEPRFTQEANYIPARIADDAALAAEEMARDIIHTLGFNNTGFHCEMRLTKNGPVLLEIAARLPGGPLQPGHLRASGINLTKELINVWLGRPYHLTPSKQEHILQKAVFPRQRGTINDIRVEKDAHKHVDLIDFALIVEKGERVVTYPDIPKPFYYYAISAPSKDALGALSEHIESSVIITIE